MSYFEKIQILAADSPSIDAFARWRVSDAITIFANKQLYDSGSLNWSTGITGNATASFNRATACITMSAVGNPSRVIRQTKRYFNYQSGKSQLVVCTGNFSGSASGSIKRIGYFDNNDGIFFQMSGSSFGTVLRNNTVDTFTSQSNWNLDIFNGTGPSGKTIDTTKAQIYFMDFEWLGVGRVRYGIYQAGIPTYVHQITNVNALNSVYMSSPNLPIRYEVINSGSAQQNMQQICSTVISEGGFDPIGQYRSVGHGFLNNASSVVTANTWFGITAIRLKSGSLSNSATVQQISALNTAGNNNWGYGLFLNPTTGSNFLWQDGTDSACEWATGSVTLTTGTGMKLMGGFVAAASDIAEEIGPRSAYNLGSDINGVSDVLVLAVNTTTTNQTFVGDITYQENS